MERIKTLIMGAAGRDFHNFNTIYRDNNLYDVVAFTATQIPDIDGRKYPAALAGKLYPKGIPIHAEDELEALIKKHNVEEVVFAYSDVPYNYVMSRGSRVQAAGAHFKILGAQPTMIPCKKPVVSIGAIRTGAGKSQTTRRVAEVLRSKGLKVAAIRHPMPYGDLVKQKVQRYANLNDLKKHQCTLEEIEEYEPHIVTGTIIYAGVDYAAIIEQAQKEADVILWDGGNNDTPFYKTNMHIVIVDPLRVGHESTYFPGEANLRLADVVVINKIDSADIQSVNTLRANVRKINPKAVIVDAASPLTVDHPEKIMGKRALVVEDGPTLTHGEMKFGAGIVAAMKYNASAIIDPRPYTVASITETYKKYPDIGTLLPAMGYGAKQMKDLETTINRTPCDVVVIGTPIDLSRIINIKKPTVRVKYDLQEIGTPNLDTVLSNFVKKIK